MIKPIDDPPHPTATAWNGHNGGSCWFAPSQSKSNPDPRLYFILDLGQTKYVEKLVVLNLCHGAHNTQKYEVGASDDPASFTYGPVGELIANIASCSAADEYLQDVPVNQVGRYVRFNIKTWGVYSPGLCYVEVQAS